MLYDYTRSHRLKKPYNLATGSLALSMQRFELFFTQSWYMRMQTWEKELVRTSVELFAREERTHSFFADYSFVVFPMSKAYEGFLKHLFFDLNLISLAIYQDKKFRIGRALNPDINPNRRESDWVYGALSEQCGQEAARNLWDTWLVCRNQVFHFFPNNEKRLTLAEAGEYLEKLATAMNGAVTCAQKGTAIY
jgi:hypothetical protein